MKRFVTIIALGTMIYAWTAESCRAQAGGVAGGAGGGTGAGSGATGAGSTGASSTTSGSSARSGQTLPGGTSTMTPGGTGQTVLPAPPPVTTPPGVLRAGGIGGTNFGMGLGADRLGMGTNFRIRMGKSFGMNTPTNGGLGITNAPGTGLGGSPGLGGSGPGVGGTGSSRGFGVGTNRISSP
jgi:hypothetical protein